MGWKYFSSSFKGAIIGGIIGTIIGIFAIFAIIAIALEYDCASYVLNCTPSLWQIIFFYFSGGWLISFLNDILPPFMDSPMFVSIPLHYLIYGVIIGWIIGKIRNLKNGKS